MTSRIVSAADHLTQKTIQAAVVPRWGHIHRGPLCCKRLGTAIPRWDSHTYSETRPQLRHPRTLPDSCARGWEAHPGAWCVLMCVLWVTGHISRLLHTLPLECELWALCHWLDWFCSCSHIHASPTPRRTSLHSNINTDSFFDLR